MLIFGHLCIGAVLGLFLSRLTRNQSMVLFAVFGSLLPDLVDKPLELLGLGDILGYEVLFLHTFLALIVLCVAGTIAFRISGSPVPAVIAVTVGLHQVMDLMWTAPGRWFYPFLGPIRRSCSCLTQSHPHLIGPISVKAPLIFFGRTVAGEVLSPSEWVFLVVLALILLAPRLEGRAFLWGPGMLGILSIASIAPLAGLPVHLIAEGGTEMDELLLVVSAAGSLGLWLYDRLDRSGQKEQILRI
jgi:hypothetical protein